MRFIIVKSCSTCPYREENDNWCKFKGMVVDGVWDVDDKCPLLTEGELYDIMRNEYEKNRNNTARD